MNAQSDFDPQALDRLRTLGGESLVRKLVNVFGEYATDRVRDAVSAGQAGDLDALARAAHALRSSAGNVGAVRLMAIATQLEHEARAGRPDAVPGLVSDLHTAFVATCRYLATAIPEAA